MRRINNSGYSAPITGRVLCTIRGVPSLVLNIDWIVRDISDEDEGALAEFLYGNTGQYYGRCL